jgi:type VI protein secretion system component VasK
VVLIGFVLLAVAVAAAIVAIVANRSVMVDVHALGYTWNVHLYWVLVAGMIVAAVGFLGLAMMRVGAAHSVRVRRERRGLKRENARLSSLAQDRNVEDPEPAVASQSVDSQPITSQSPLSQSVTGRPHLFHRTRQV